MLDLPVANGVKAPKVTQSTGINPGKPNTGFIISSCIDRILNEGTSSVYSDSPATVRSIVMISLSPTSNQYQYQYLNLFSVPDFIVRYNQRSDSAGRC